MWTTNDYLIVSILVLGCLWLVASIWLGLMMLANRKEEYGFFVNEIGGKLWKQYGPLGIGARGFSASTYTEKGNKYRVLFIPVFFGGMFMLFVLASFLDKTKAPTQIDTRGRITSLTGTDAQ